MRDPKRLMGRMCLVCGNECKRRFGSAKHTCDCPELQSRATHIRGSRSAIKDEIERLTREVEKAHAATLKSGKPRGRRVRKAPKLGLVLQLSKSDDMFHDAQSAVAAS